MKLLVVGSLVLGGMVSACSLSGIHLGASAQDNGSLTGTVERVWEDGFRLNTGERTIRVDSWEVCGDFTANHVAVGDRISIIGEFSGREFDAFGIMDTDGNSLCPTAFGIPSASEQSPAQSPDQPEIRAQAPVPQGNSLSGSVERVWEDGFRLNTGERDVRVDSWNVCGDFTANHVAVGDRLTVSGEFDGGEFDAFSIANSNGAFLCR
jgi:hypothetical protein